MIRVTAGHACSCSRTELCRKIPFGGNQHTGGDLDLESEHGADGEDGTLQEALIHFNSLGNELAADLMTDSLYRGDLRCGCG